MSSPPPPVFKNSLDNASPRGVFYSRNPLNTVRRCGHDGHGERGGARDQGQGDVPARWREQPARPVPLRAGRAGGAARRATTPDLLDAVPRGAVESFAGVGYFFDLADLRRGRDGRRPRQRLRDGRLLRRTAGRPDRSRLGVDFTDGAAGQGAPARRTRTGSPTWSSARAASRALPLDDASVDCVISNGVINLCPDKAAVFAEAARVLRPGGRLAIADIVTEQQLTDAIVCNADLWASCIGGAAQQDALPAAIEAAGFTVVAAPRQPLRVHLRPGPQRQRHVRREEHLAARNQARSLITKRKRELMSDIQNIDTRTSGVRSRATATWTWSPSATSPWAAASSSPAGAGRRTSSRSPAPTPARPTTPGSACRGRWPSGPTTASELTVGPGDVVDLDPGHDAWTRR